jgi:hypothetical protein
MIISNASSGDAVMALSMAQRHAARRSGRPTKDPVWL